MAYIFINRKNFGLLREAFLKNATCWSLKVYFRAKNKERQGSDFKRTTGRAWKFDCIKYRYTTQNMTFIIKDFFSKRDQIRSSLRIRSHLMKKSLMKNFIFCAVLLHLISWCGYLGSSESWLSRLKFCENCAFPQHFHTRKVRENW